VTAIEIVSYKAVLTSSTTHIKQR